MKNENGIESGARDAGRGIGAFLLSVIPLSLGAGCAVWLGAYIQAHEFFHLLSQEHRAAVYVESPKPQTNPIHITALKPYCFTVAKADLDGSSLVIYARNDCNAPTDYVEYHWEGLSPNGTIVSSGYTNTATCPAPTKAHDIAECHISVSTDERILEMRVFVR